MMHRDLSRGIRIAVFVVAAVAWGASEAGTQDVCPDAIPLTGGTTYSESGFGTVPGGYHYELYNEGSGIGDLTVYGKGAAFK